MMTHPSKHSEKHCIMKHPRGNLVIIVGAVFVLIVMLWLAIHLKRYSPRAGSKPPGQTIDLLVGALEKHQHVFLSPEFYPCVPSQYLKSLPSLGEAATATKDFSAFYRLNREKRFSLLILGTHPLSSAMVRELISSPLWILSDASSWGYIITQNISGKSLWSPPTADALSKKYPDATARTEWLISTAENLVSIRRTGDAEALLRQVASTGMNHARLQAAQASLAAAQGRWIDALALAKEACRADPDSATTSEILIRALTECGRPNEALDVARKLTENLRNQESLFLLARAANAANSKEEEVTALRSLVALGREQHQTIGASLTYLGQAFARNGERGEALRTFQEALSQPELTQEQRSLLGQLIEHLTPEGYPAPKN